MASVSGDMDLSSHDGQFLARILGAVARKESDDKSRRITRKHLELAQAGRAVGGGDRPFGWRADRRTVEPTEAVVDPRGCRAHPRWRQPPRHRVRLERPRVTSVRGGQWSITVLRRMLVSPAAVGPARLQGRDRRQGRLGGDRGARGGRPGARHPDAARAPDQTHRATLSALRRTPPLRAVRIGPGGPSADRGTRRYVCAKGPGLPGCGRIAVLAEPVEDLIAQAVLYRLDTPELAAALAGAVAEDAEAEAAQASLSADRAQLEELATAYGDRQITFPEYLAARKPIEARIEAGARKVGRLTHTAAIAGHVGDATALRATWAELPLTRQRSIVAAVLDRALVRPAVRGRTVFDPDRIEPVWRL